MLSKVAAQEKMGDVLPRNDLRRERHPHLYGYAHSAHDVERIRVCGYAYSTHNQA